VRQIENLKTQSGDKPWHDATIIGKNKPPTMGLTEY
jgi:hypothetical protein